MRQRMETGRVESAPEIPALILLILIYLAAGTIQGDVARLIAHWESQHGGGLPTEIPEQYNTR